jgi:riboflavin synthase
MFTGIVQTSGFVTRVEQVGEDIRIAIDIKDVDLATVSIGDSICINGVCITVIEILDKAVVFDISNETLSCTTFANLKPSARVNVELAMKITDRFDGHIVSGHVDTVGKLLTIVDDGRSKRFEFEVPAIFSKYICPKGSVCIDGVSLTVNTVNANTFGVNIIPHTLLHTTFPDYVAGSTVNIEVDIISRYLERLVEERQ